MARVHHMIIWRIVISSPAISAARRASPLRVALASRWSRCWRNILVAHQVAVDLALLVKVMVKTADWYTESRARVFLMRTLE